MEHLFTYILDTEFHKMFKINFKNHIYHLFYLNQNDVGFSMNNHSL